jgi:hypothetical protein
MDAHCEKSGLKGVGFLFGMIALVLLVLCLKETRHSAAAIASGLVGDALLLAGTGAFLLRRWRAAADETAFHEDGDVQFALAVFLLVLIAPLIRAISSAPALVMLIPAAAIPVRTFVKSLRHPR